jgi:hypothetical protein
MTMKMPDDLAEAKRACETFVHKQAMALKGPETYPSTAQLELMLYEHLATVHAELKQIEADRPPNLWIVK